MSEQVEFRHLKYIVAVAEAENFTRAAAITGTAMIANQPQHSLAIRLNKRAPL